MGSEDALENETCAGGTLGDLPVCPVWLTALLEDTFKTKLVAISGKRVDKDQGYLSFIGKLELQWETNDQHADGIPQTLIIKMPTVTKIIAELGKFVEKADTDEKVEKAKQRKQEMLECMKKAHNNECFMYQFLTDDNKITGTMPLVHCYRSKPVNDPSDQAYLLMEDLTSTAKTPDFAKGISLGQCRRLIESIAALQAFGLTHSGWKGKVQTPFKYDDMAKYLAVACGAVRKVFPDVFTFSDDDLAKITKVPCYDLSKINGGDYVPVLCHGDLWVNNALFGLDATKTGTTDELVAVIDWQTVDASCCTMDLARLLVACLDWRTRREHTNALLDEYYEFLRQKLPAGYDIPFSLAEVKQLYNETLGFGATILLVQSPLFVGNPENFKTYSKEELKSFAQRIQFALDDALEFV